MNKLLPDSSRLLDVIQQMLFIIIIMTVTFFVQELPNSNVLQTALPEWPFIFTLFFAVSTRYYFSVSAAFLVGLVEDAFLGVPTMGLHAIIYTLAAFTMIIIRHRFRQCSIVLQSLIIGLLVLLKVVLFMIYNSVVYAFPAYFWVLLSVPASILAWPLVHVFFSYFSHRNAG